MVRWVESAAGPLIAVPEAVLPFWAGADGDETSSDHDRACDLPGHAGLLPVGDTLALVLGGEPAATAYLPEHGLFVRRCAAGDEPRLLSEARLIAEVPAALDDAVWEPALEWRVPGPLVLFDAARSGRAATATDHARVELAPGRYGVGAGYVPRGPWAGLRLVRVGPPAG